MKKEKKGKRKKGTDCGTNTAFIDYALDSVI